MVRGSSNELIYHRVEDFGFESTSVRVGTSSPANREAEFNPRGEVRLDEESRVRAELLPEIIFELTSYGNVSYVNGAWERAFQLSLEESIARSFLDFVAPKDQEKVRQSLESPRLFDTIEVRLVRPSGEPVLGLLCRIRLSEGGVIGSFYDFNKQLQEERQERAIDFQALLSAAPDAMVVATTRGEIILANSQVRALFGYEPEDLLGKRADSLLPERLRSRHVFKKMRSLSDFRSKGEVYGAGFDEEGIFALRKDGTEFPAEVNLSTVQVSQGQVLIAAIRDVSHRLKLEQELLERTRELEEQIAGRTRVEEELRMAHKLEAVGQMAAGIAHEINTPLQYVGDSLAYVREAVEDLNRLTAAAAQLLDSGLSVKRTRNLLRDLERDYDYEFLKSELPKALNRAEEGLRRVTDIVDSMRQFSHPDDGIKEVADINKVLRVSLRLTRSEYKNVAFVETNYAPQALALCSSGALTQAFVNLITNAIHAISEKFALAGKMGLIRIDTIVAEEAIIVRISDNGAGVPENLRDRIYDPFFTTKVIGLGTGQGLPIARAIIVEGHGGYLKCESRTGLGTTFEVSIPTRGSKQVMS